MLDESVRTALRSYMISLEHIDKPAEKINLYFLHDDIWLMDSAVIEHIIYKKGCWDVFLVFAHHKFPLQLFVRFMVSCISESRGKATAYYMRKMAAKDQRGTLSIQLKDLNLSIN